MMGSNNVNMTSGRVGRTLYVKPLVAIQGCRATQQIDSHLILRKRQNLGWLTMAHLP